MSDLSDLLSLRVIEEEDNSITIEWDPNDPRAIELGINEWTEEDWIEALENSVKHQFPDESVENSSESN